MSENLPQIPSDRKRAAARINGAKAKGTKSPEGLAISALNAVKHGITARTTFLLDYESQQRWNDLLACFRHRFQPWDEVEDRLVCQLVLCEWRRERVQDVEAAVLDFEMSRQLDKLNAEYEFISDDVRLALAFNGQQELLARLYYYAMRLEYESNRAYTRLMKLQDRRPLPPPAEPDASADAPDLPPDDESITQNEAKMSAEEAPPDTQTAQNQTFTSVRVDRSGSGPRIIRRRAPLPDLTSDSAPAAHHAPEVAKAAS